MAQQYTTEAFEVVDPQTGQVHVEYRGVALSFQEAKANARKVKNAAKEAAKEEARINKAVAKTVREMEKSKIDLRKKMMKNLNKKQPNKFFEFL